MRLGLSTNMNAHSAKEWAETMQALGCRSVVFPLDCSVDDALVNEYVKEAKAHDLLIAEVGIWRNALATDPAERRKNIDYSIAQLRLAERIGARCCVNVAGAFGARWDGGYKENFTKEAWDATVAMVQEIIDAVNPKNTYFSLEPMPWMIPTGPEQYLKLIQDVNRERFAVHMDIINMINCPDRYFFQEEFLEKTFSLLGSRIKSCHLKNVRLLDGFTFQLLECDCSEGCFNLERYAELASKADADMPMIIEHLANDEAYRQSIAYTKERLAAYL